MLNLTKFSPLEMFMLIAMSMLGALSLVIEVFTNAGPGVVPGATSFTVLEKGASFFVPSVTVSPLNHIMILFSIVLCFLGVLAFVKAEPNLRKIWIYLQVPYWFAQFLAFVLIGIYPIAGICFGLYFGASIYLAINQSLAAPLRG